MKKYILMLAVLGIAGFYIHEYFAEKRILRIGVECDYAPNNWEENQPSDSNFPIANHQGFYAEGYDLQIAKLVADELHANLEVKKIAWNDLPKALNSNEIDAIFSGMLDTEARRKFAAFSDVYDVVRTEYTIAVNTSSPYANSKKLNDFAGARLVAQKGTHLDDVIDQIEGVIHMPPVDTVTEMLDMVIKGEVDGTVINLDTGQSYERKHNNLRVIRFPEGEGFKLNFNGICAGVRKKDTELLNEINAALSKISKRDRRRLMDRTIARAIKALP
ncbi:MAG: transporter substrate-binding domain-containing protein [Synergistaceae bacterium]|nr:transporter substrate-binding domain-containing protein [Synergistaceae bacterium]